MNDAVLRVFDWIQNASLTIEDSTIYNFLGAAPNGFGILVNPTSGTSRLVVRNTTINNNGNAANGAGCIADPAEPASTHFVSADGHYNPTGDTHGQHSGDMPALHVTAYGSARMSFVTDRFTAEEIRGKAIIVHPNPDNYGNVPVGSAPTQYTPNSAEATTLTQNTGNAGARIACGVIE